MELIIYWKFILNSTDDTAVLKVKSTLTLLLECAKLSITHNEIYWKDKTKYLLEFRQVFDKHTSIDQTISNLMDQISHISFSWNLIITSLNLENFDMSGTTETLNFTEIMWAGFNAEIN